MSSTVKGPTSALSSFLSNDVIGLGERGISTVPRRPWVFGERPTQVPQEEQEEREDQAPAAEDQVDFTVNRSLSRQPVDKGKKKPKLDNDKDPGDPKSLPVGPCCHRCGRPLNSAVHGRDTVLCDPCLKLSTLVPERKGRRQKVVKRVQQDWLVDDLNKRILSLHDLCVRLITENIQDVESFGAISAQTRDKISLILSKHRLLNDTTVKLFLDLDCDELFLYDCANVTNTGFEVIGYFSPNLRRLKLKECGQIRDDAIQVLASQLAQLEEVTLSGCFLVTDTAMAHAINSWSHLKSLRIEHCPKLGPLCAEAISSIPTLQQLSLVSCDGLQDDHLNVIASKASSLNSFELIRCPMVRSTETLRRFLFSNLQSLTLSYLQIPEEDWSLLMQQLPSFPLLVRLNISGNPGMDMSIITAQCPNLQSLDISRMEEKVDNFPSITRLESLRELRLNGQREITTEEMETAFQALKNLEIVDISWVLNFNDIVMDLLLMNNLNVCKLYGWGCHRVSDFNRERWCRERKQLTLVGLDPSQQKVISAN